MKTDGILFNPNYGLDMKPNTEHPRNLGPRSTRPASPPYFEASDDEDPLDRTLWGWLRSVGEAGKTWGLIRDYLGFE